MKRAYIFVEGPTDAELLRRILPSEVLQDTEVVTAGGIPSLARTVLARRKRPVVVVMDAESVAPDVIEERRGSTEELIRAADASIPVKVIAAVPNTEAWFFAAPEAIARTLGESVPNDLVTLGKRDPSGVLQLLTAKSQREWDSRRAIGLLDAEDIDRIRALPEVRELTTFLQKIQKDDKAA